MDTLKAKYDFFTEQIPLTQVSLKDLVRLCGYAPTEKQIANAPIPTNFEEFLDITAAFEKKGSKEDIYNQLISLCGGSTITKDELIRVLHAGDKLSDEEIDGFFRMVNDDKGNFSVKEIVDVLYCDD
ncbi:hypothetical protein GVAV_000213 [Gurleya vavrai]